MEYESIGQIRQLLKSGERGCRELAEEAMDRADQSGINAFISLDRGFTQDQADAAQKRIDAGEDASLLGIPYAVKDIFNVRGMETTCASRILGGYRSPYESTVTSRCKEAGLVLVGKTNMDEFAMGSSGENSSFGSTLNPWDHAHVTGGSSSGSAAAVAAGVVPFAIGTDTGGSVRQPASFCGICGIKPTYGRVSRYGIVAFASSLDQAGVFALSARDLAIATSAIIGHDPKDSTSMEAGEERLEQDLGAEVKGMRIGVPEEFFSEGLESGVRSAVEEAIAEFGELGAKIERVKLPSLKYSIPAYYVLSSAEASSNLSRYDGVRFGVRKQGDSLLEMYENTREEGFGAEVKRRILIGTYVLSYGYYDAYYRHARRVRHLIADDFAAAFERCDVLMGPTTPTTAFKLGDKIDDPVRMYLNDIFTASVNLAGLPGMSIPCGFDEANLPIGLQLIGPSCSEARLLRFAHHYQQRTDWHNRRPPS